MIPGRREHVGNRAEERGWRVDGADVSYLIHLLHQLRDLGF